MKHFVFEDTHTGEEFIVGENTYEEALAEAKNWFADPQFICEFTEDEAEASGLDEY